MSPLSSAARTPRPGTVFWTGGFGRSGTGAGCGPAGSGPLGAGRGRGPRREWVEDYVTKKLVQPPASVPEIHVVRVRKPRKAQAVFRKGGAGYEFLKERQRNQRQRGQG